MPTNKKFHRAWWEKFVTALDFTEESQKRLVTALKVAGSARHRCVFTVVSAHGTASPRDVYRNTGAQYKRMLRCFEDLAEWGVFDKIEVPGKHARYKLAETDVVDDIRALITYHTFKSDVEIYEAEE